MRNFILFDDTNRHFLYPFTIARPVSSLRIGILTIAEKWNLLLGSETSCLTEPFLQEKYNVKAGKDNILINAAFLPNAKLIEKILLLNPDQALVKDDHPIAVRLTAENLHNFSLGLYEKITSIEFEESVNQITNSWDILKINKEEIEKDYSILTSGSSSQALSSTNTVLGNKLFIEKGAAIEGTFFDTRKGAVYVGENACIMPGTIIEGPVAICNNATIKMGTHLYAGTTIGMWCKAGGEISNSILSAYSAKAHDGYLGDSILGEWCNLGAGTITSNLKNNYELVKSWSYSDKRFVNTGLQFLGLLMGDHSKSGIHTMFNSGTTVGMACNVFGDGYQRNFIPSFSWGGTAGFRKHKINEVIETARSVFKRRNMELSESEKQILIQTFHLISENRFL